MGINDVSDAFTEWLAPYTAQRQTATVVKGKKVAGVSTAVPFDGVIQNANPEDLKALPEGSRTEEAIKIHTGTELLPQIDNSQDGDVVPYDSKEYLIVNVADRKIGNYYKAIGLKI